MMSQTEVVEALMKMPKGLRDKLMRLASANARFTGCTPYEALRTLLSAKANGYF